ncbi:hypothetical protein QYE76_059444 [Lolium multiflorum]|uniref:CCHC-type domain-containing protein n=1 Tax=Lolium multiflorum TaxID=4521 RepID=A0AAD8RX62_LOLMU|nr:hypothetical protein QYE76_059444 [Lolium multiflorum]
MENIIVLIDIMIAMKTHAQTLDVESFIAMLVLMNILRKKKYYNKLAINMIAMPTMGVTTNPTTTSSTTWNRHRIVSHMLMLKTKVIKIHRGVIFGIILAITNMGEENQKTHKMREPSMNIVTNLAKIFDNTIIVNQVKLVFNFNTNPMLWNLEDEENMYGKLKFNMPKFKGEDDAEAYLSWALKVDKIFRIHNYSGAKKVAMASLEFEDYANTWWEQVVTLREEKGEPPIDTWEEMKEEMQARFVPTHYKTDLFNKLQKLKQGTKTVEEFYKEMELTMMQANIQESENQTIARFFNGLNYPIKRIVEFQKYSNVVELVHQASKAERQVNEDIKYSKTKQYFASKIATPPPTTSVKPSVSSTPSKQPTIQSRMKQTVTSTASSKASTGPSNVTCFKCGTQGHKSFECKNTKVMITMENGDIETLSEGEYEALVQAAVANEEAYDEESGEDPPLCVHDTSPSLVVTRVLTTQPQALEDQRCNIFQTRAGIGGKSIKVIIDGGSCHNLASTEMCEKLNLTLRKHPHPYHVQWLSDKGNVKIQHTVTVNFKIGPYEDTVECDVVPMTVCHMLLGRPWKYDNKVIHDGHSNVYTFKVKDKKFELRPMTSSQIIADNAKEFQDVFPDELPHGLPPLRGIEHRIDLIPGAPLPNRAAYRTNPEDTKEIQRQIQDLLAKAYVAHQDPGEEDTPWSREGEKQLDMKMDVELDPTSCEARQGKEEAGRPRTRLTGVITGFWPNQEMGRNTFGTPGGTSGQSSATTMSSSAPQIAGEPVKYEDLPPEHKKKYDDLKAILEAELIGAFEKTRSHGIKFKGFQPEGALDGLDQSLPSDERTRALRQEVNYVVAHSLHRHAESLVNTLERVALNVVQEVTKHKYSPSGPALGTHQGEVPLYTRPPLQHTFAAPQQPGSPAYVVYKIGGDPGDYQFLYEPPKEIPHGYQGCHGRGVAGAGSVGADVEKQAWLAKYATSTSHQRSTSAAPTVDEITAIMRDQFGILPKKRMIGYSKPYPNDYDLIPLPPKYRLPDFTKFSGSEGTSSIEHVSRFLAQLGMVSASDELRVRFFSQSLTSPAFGWYTSLLQTRFGRGSNRKSNSTYNTIQNYGSQPCRSDPSSETRRDGIRVHPEVQTVRTDVIRFA